jgi:hypothetical protein
MRYRTEREEAKPQPAKTGPGGWVKPGCVSCGSPHAPFGWRRPGQDFVLVQDWYCREHVPVHFWDFRKEERTIFDVISEEDRSKRLADAVANGE